MLSFYHGFKTLIKNFLWTHVNLFNLISLGTTKSSNSLSKHLCFTCSQVFESFKPRLYPGLTAVSSIVKAFSKQDMTRIPRRR